MRKKSKSIRQTTIRPPRKFLEPSTDHNQVITDIRTHCPIRDGSQKFGSSTLVLVLFLNPRREWSQTIQRGSYIKGAHRRVHNIPPIPLIPFFKRTSRKMICTITSTRQNGQKHEECHAKRCSNTRNISRLWNEQSPQSTKETRGREKTMVNIL